MKQIQLFLRRPAWCKKSLQGEMKLWHEYEAGLEREELKNKERKERDEWLAKLRKRREIFLANKLACQAQEKA